jgi:serine/threonine-protein kinase
MSAEPEDRLPPGTVLAGRFRVERMLGRGGMGAVYGALHMQLGQYYAIKILQGEAARDPDSIARFKQEAQIASRLPGPNVVRVHDLGQTEVGEPFIVMELLSGRDLDTVVMDQRPIPVVDAVNLMCQACLGVATAHRRTSPRETKASRSRRRRSGRPSTCRPSRS